MVGDARAAVGFAALGVNGFNLLSQGFICFGSFAGLELPFLPVVITTGRDFKKPAGA